MREEAEKELRDFLNRYPEMADMKESIEKSFQMLVRCAEEGGTIYVCGNGGSAADSEHIVGELMKGFKKKRPVSEEEKNAFGSMYGEEGLSLASGLQKSIKAVSLVSQVGLSTAFSNDVDAKKVYAQQIYGYGSAKDILWGISTSGNSENVVQAAMAARVKNVAVMGMTGIKNSRLSSLSDVCIQVPFERPDQVQEAHLPIYHCLCAMIEAYFFND